MEALDATDFEVCLLFLDIYTPPSIKSGKQGDKMKQLKKQRLDMGLSQKQVAEMCGIKQGYYSRIESNIRKPSVELAKKLANLLQIDWTEFFN